MNESQIFTDALKLASASERAAYLDAVCSGDPQLRAGVEALLQAHASDPGFLENSASSFGVTVDSPAARSAPTPGEAAGTVIGPYKLIEQIGEGGMGTVWMAQQTDPVKRLVAVKLIKAGMDSKQVIARFEAERQALALMEHPNIARVLDAGTTTAGRPYFVMDLVKGVPITRYCDEHHLTPRQRLELFIPICQAIQHAHQKGIIHRDLKPSNVLVAHYDGKPVPKVIDFGVAKAAGQVLTEKTLVTGFGNIVGTLEYMSPEQAEVNQLDIDTRSDIYSLGVLLYELLAGSPPFTRMELEKAGMLEMLRVIREQEPSKPSTKLSSSEALPTLSANRGTEPAKLTKLVRGELDWIVMKALEKDRNRRYETANGFAADVQRYLNDETVQACPPSAGYKLRKFGRKYRTALNIAAVVVALLVAAAAISAWQAVRATLAEQQAVDERDRAKASFRMAREAVDRFFTQVSENPELKDHAMEKFRKELLQNAKEFYERFIREQLGVPSVRHDLGLAHYRLAKIQEVLSDFAAAQTLSEKAIEILRELTRAHPEVADYQRDLAASYVWLGVVYFDTDRLELAESAYQQGVEIQERVAGEYPDVGDYRHALALTHMRLGDLHYRAHQLEKARVNQERALSLLAKLADDKKDIADYQYGLATIKGNLGETYGRMGSESEKAETVLKEAQSAFQKLVLAHPDVPDYRKSLGRTYRALGYLYHDNMREAQKAEAAAQQALQIFEKLAQEHPQVLEYVHWAGVCYGQLGLAAELGGQPDAALARYDKSIEILERVVGRGYGAARIFLVDSRLYRASVLPARGEHARAVEEMEAVGKQEGLNGPNYYNIACVFSRSSAAAGNDARLSPADRTRLTAQYAGRAMDFLRQAVANGFLNVPAIKSDPDLAPLHTREDYKKLVQELESKQKPAEK